MRRARDCAGAIRKGNRMSEEQLKTELVDAAGIAQLDVDALVTIAHEGVETSDPWRKELERTGEFTGKLNEIAIQFSPAGHKARRVVLVGGGKADKFTQDEVRKVAGTATRALKAKGVKTVALVLDSLEPGFAAAAVEGAILGDWEPDRHKSKKEEKHLEKFLIAVKDPKALQASFERGRWLAESQNLTRELVNEPPNLLTPLVLAARAKKMAEANGLECEILDEERMRVLGMGSLLGVSMGSAQPPALIVLRYRPATPASGDHLGLVGKGVTFDTGGISIKPAEGMEKMKSDMAGGAAAIGAMQAIARLKPSIAVTAFIPAVENMPSDRAQRPGDIVTSMSGKTIEVLNTDAEGRLILNDAITYAKQQGCTHLVDAATLTGAVVVALGFVNVGVFSNDEEFQAKLLKAAKAAGEKMWPLPLDEEYRELLKSPYADIANIGGRWGGAISAAMFLKEFAGETPWVHLDIAGTALLEQTRPFLANGATGVAVRTFVNLAVSW